MLTGTFGLMSQRSGPFLHPIIKRIEPYRRTKCRAAAERIKDAVKEDVQGSPQVPDVAVLRSSTFESTGAFESPREIGDVKDVDEPSGLQALWNKLSGKEKIIVATFLSFIICNMVSEKALNLKYSLVFLTALVVVEEGGASNIHTCI